jgi:hypothetical protein
VALNICDEDELPLIKTISKLKCKSLSYFLKEYFFVAFEYEKLYEAQRQELLKRCLSLLDAGEFFDLLIPCFGDAVDKFGILMSRQVKDTLASRLNKIMIKSVRELTS